MQITVNLQMQKTSKNRQNMGENALIFLNKFKVPLKPGTLCSFWPEFDTISSCMTLFKSDVMSALSYGCIVQRVTTAHSVRTVTNPVIAGL